MSTDGATLLTTSVEGTTAWPSIGDSSGGVGGSALDCVGDSCPSASEEGNASALGDLPRTLRETFRKCSNGPFIDEYESRKPSSVCMGDINLFFPISTGSFGAVSPVCVDGTPTGLRLSVFERDLVAGASLDKSFSLFEAVFPIVCSF